MTKVGFIFFALLIATLARADEQLKMKARAEAESPRVLKPTATDVSLSPDSTSVLSLTDPTPDQMARSYQWLLGMKIQSFQPSGQLQGEKTAPLRLENISSFYLPSLETGLRFQAADVRWHWGLLLHGGYSSQPALVSYSDETQDPEARFTTILSDAGLMLEYEPTHSWGLQSSLGAGVINYSQAGASAYSTVTSDATFQFFSIGGHVNLHRRWQVLVSYMNRNLLNSQNSEIFLPTDSAELGTRFIW